MFRCKSALKSGLLSNPDLRAVFITVVLCSRWRVGQAGDGRGFLGRAAGGIVRVLLKSFFVQVVSLSMNDGFLVFKMISSVTNVNIMLYGA